MKKAKLTLVTLCIAATVFSAKPGGGGLLDNDPFLNETGIPTWAKDMETLVYRVSFFGIPAGYAEFQYVGEEVEEGRDLFHIRLRAWTTGLVKFFKEVQDVFDFYVDRETLLPWKVVSVQKSSGKTKNKIVYYDQGNGVLRYYTPEGRLTREFKAVPRVFEPVTVAYFLRTKNLLFETPQVNMYGGKRLYELGVDVLGKERVKTDIGVFDAIKIKPLIKRKDGGESKKVEVVAWLIDDGSNIPILVHAKLKVGTLTGELVSFIKGGGNGG